jgi:DNA invertase Pin-like site-specific DNA recombinase
MLIGYARVSTDDQLLDRQIDALIAHGIDEHNIYCEKVSGAKRTRKELNRMIAEVEDGDIIVVVELTRLGRSVKDLFDLVEQIRNKGAEIRSLKESWLDTSTPQGKLMFTIFAGLSQFERDLISERTKEGLVSARKRGRFGGRPSKPNAKAAFVQSLYNKKSENQMSTKEIANCTGLSVSTINRIVKTQQLSKSIQ